MHKLAPQFYFISSWTVLFCRSIAIKYFVHNSLALFELYVHFNRHEYRITHIANLI